MKKTKAELQKQSDRAIDVLTKETQRARRVDSHHRANVIFLRAKIERLTREAKKDQADLILLRDHATRLTESLADVRCELLIERATRNHLAKRNNS